MNPELPSPLDDPLEQPLCLNCLQPVDPLFHYCPRCGAAVGQHTPNIPFVNIPYQMEFWGHLWKRIWSHEPGDVFVRTVGSLMIIFFAPLMLLGLPVLIYRLFQRQGRGFEVIVKDPSQIPQELPPPQDESLS